VIEGTAIKLPVAELMLMLTPQQVMCKYTSTHRVFQASSIHIGDDDKHWRAEGVYLDEAR
jgi:hypothetical protein